MNDNLELSEDLVEFVKSAEGFLAVAKQQAIDRPSVWTIGYGDTIGVKPGQTTTPEEAESVLRNKLAWYGQKLLKFVKVEINQNQYSALIDFSYNLGVAALAGSTLLKKLNSGDPTCVDEFKRWNIANGKILPGLVSRRQWEADLFSKKTT
jgi:GH24 family phage-related lysozyme (muramidase)